MKKALATIVLAVCVLYGAEAFGTPSTHVWSPSTDIQAYGVGHITADMYVPVKNDSESTPATRPGTVTNLGLTVGVFPYEKLGLEVGFDHIAGFGDYDTYPLYFNAKLGVPEGALGANTPALAIGSYMIGTKSGGESRAGKTPKIGTDVDIYYAKAAKTIGNLGRFSVGYYTGNKSLLVDENGKADEEGVLLAWERTMSEISDNLWLCVDYMGGDSSFGALAYGFSWKFAPNTSVIFGYIDQNNDDIAALEDSFTVQVDIDFDIFK
ncbi:MAG TPA: hypothetical protein VFF54_06595 [Thermodesulfobacteriota bacterium]|nr:hypothetical protein [Thermodesulfobacteriota bacterium]